MKKFILFKNDGEVKKVYEGCTLDKRDVYPERIKEFSNKEEALKELSKYDSKVTDHKKYFLVEEYYIEELEEDNNGDFIGGGDIWDYSKLPDKYSKFYINDKGQSGYSFKKYTFEEVKEFFKREEDEDVEYIGDDYYTIEEENDMIDNCEDIDELKDVLTKLMYGLEFSYIIEKC